MEAPAVIKTVGHFISGAVVGADDSARYGDIYDPARGEVQARLAFADQATIDRAVAVAKKAHKAWSATPLGKRRAEGRTAVQTPFTQLKGRER